MAGIEAPAAASLAEQVENARVQAEAETAAAAAAGEGEPAQGEATEAQAAQGEDAEVQGAQGEDACENAEAQAVPAKAAEAQAAPAESLKLSGDKQSACDDAAEQPVEDAASAEGAEGAEVAGENASASDKKPAELEAPARLKHASDNLTSLDYTMWDVRLADGTVRTLDSVAGTWA